MIKFIKRLLKLLLIITIIFSAIYIYRNNNVTKERKSTNTHSSNSFDNKNDAIKYLRKNMVNRVNTISITFNTSEDIDYNTIANIFYNEAIKHTGVDNEGDYIKYHIDNVEMNTNYKKFINNEYKMTYKIKYRSLKDQEEKMDTLINDIAKNVNGLSDFDKIKYINNYIINHVSYNSVSENMYSAYGALAEKKAVCQGYALLCYRLLLKVGIDNRMITGIGKTGNNENAHAWNIVKLGNIYYGLDVTWNDSSIKNLYFLKGNNSFSLTHIADKEFKSGEFLKNYPLSPTNY